MKKILYKNEKLSHYEIGDDFFMKNVLIITILALFFLGGIYRVKSEDLKIPDEAIRLRVIANSNENIDQQVKFTVTESLQNQIYELLKNTMNIEEARMILNDNMHLLDEDIKKVLSEEKYPLSYELKYGLNYFPEKKYKGVTYEEGYYESILVTLGEGEGNNWWCCLFPPLCLMEADENDVDEVEYKFFVQELIEKYF